MQAAQIGRVLITGGTSGLGLELVKLFLADGAEVFATGRNNPVELAGCTGFHFIQIDFSELHQVNASILNLVRSEPPFDLVINNAGILSPHSYRETIDGFEYTFQVNFLSHLLIDDLIVSNLTATGSLSLAFVTSPVYRFVKPTYRLPDKKSYRSFRTYCESKYNILLIGEYLRKRYPAKNIKVYGLDPGIFSSGIYRMQRKWFHRLYAAGTFFMRSPRKVAAHIHTILVNDQLPVGRIYKHSGKRSRPIPGISYASEKFLDDCIKSIRKTD